MLCRIYHGVSRTRRLGALRLATPRHRPEIDLGNHGFSHFAGQIPKQKVPQRGKLPLPHCILYLYYEFIPHQRGGPGVSCDLFPRRDGPGIPRTCLRVCELAREIHFSDETSGAFHGSRVEGGKDDCSMG